MLFGSRRDSWSNRGGWSRQLMRILPVLAATGALFVVWTSSAVAQATGGVRGTISSAESLRPLEGVQVSIEGTRIGGLTGPDGQFAINNVPAGQHVLRAQLIGYATQTREITVTEGQATRVEVELEREALGLDDIVVTGAAGAAQKREIGNSIGQINTENVSEQPSSVSDLMQAQSPGINITPSTGQSGGGASIRLRGNVSASMSNQPLIYIDGIRVRSEGLPKNVRPAGYGGHGPNTAYSPLQDISPENIARIEIIRGAAATTLYGTEAASGVIQIFTKDGVEGGDARWNLNIRQGFSQMYDFGPTEGVNGEPLTIPANEQEPSDPRQMFLDPFLRDGHRQHYALSVRGGATGISYYLSGGYDNYKGVLPRDVEERMNGRLNFTINPADNLTLDVRTGYTKTNIDQTEAGPSLGLTLNAMRRDQNYLGTSNPDSLRKTYQSDWNTYTDRFVGGVTANHAPSGLFSQRFTLGYDLVQQETKSILPFGHRFFPQGIAHDDRFQSEILSLDYVANLTFDIFDVGNRLSVGGQLVEEREERLSAQGEEFPGPGVPTVSSGANRIGFEERQTVISGGVFVQDVFSLDDRYFLTLGLRADGNSAFGEALSLEAYPKASLSYVISDEDYWPDDLGSMKLRAAWGQSGRAPGAFDATRTWSPDGWGNQPAFMPQNVGNPNLGPERTTEIEVGFDHSVFNERLSTTFTYYRQKTKEALFFVRQTPSAGFGGTQLENVGELKNEGVEISVTGRPVDRQNWGVQLDGTLSTNYSEVLDLGGAAPFSLGGDGWIVKGQPVPVIRGLKVVNPMEQAEPEIESNSPYGPNLPTNIISSGVRIRFPGDIRLSARGEYKGGHYKYSVMDGEAITRGIRWPSCYNAYPHIDSGNMGELTALERARCLASNANRDFAIYPMDFFRLRDVSVVAPIPFRVPGVRSADIRLSAQNAFTWKEAKNTFAGPESSGGFTRGSTGVNEAVQTVGGSIPIPATYTLGIQMSF